MVTSVVVVGGANVDIVGQALQVLLQGDSNPGHMAVSRGGVGRNLAENLARLGLAVRLHSAVGQDDWGRRLCEETHACGVNVQGVYSSPTLPSAHYLSLVQPDGSLYVALNDMRVLEQLTPQVLQQQGFDLRGVDALVLDCNLPADTLDWLVDQARAYPALRVVADGVSAAKCRKIAPHLAHIHLLKVNPLEAAALAGLPVDSIAQARHAARWFWQQGVRHTVLSLGKQGVCWCDASGQTGHMAVPTAAAGGAIVNTNGAGDALLAGVVHGLLASMPWQQSVQWGMACAAITLNAARANAENLNVELVNAFVQSAWPGENQPHET